MPFGKKPDKVKALLLDLLVKADETLTYHREQFQVWLGERLDRIQRVLEGNSSDPNKRIGRPPKGG